MLSLYIFFSFCYFQSMIITIVPPIGPPIPVIVGRALKVQYQLEWFYFEFSGYRESWLEIDDNFKSKTHLEMVSLMLFAEQAAFRLKYGKMCS